MPAEASKKTVSRIRENFSKWYGGQRNAGKPMVLTGGTTWKSMSITPVDAQFLETRKFQVTDIARWFRVPPHMIGDIEKTSSWGTGIEQQSLGFVRYTLIPWIARLEAADSALLQQPRFVRYNVNALIRADLKTRFDRLQRSAGWAGGCPPTTSEPSRTCRRSTTATGTSSR
jgi:HK97 family phage portal protein